MQKKFFLAIAAVMFAAFAYAQPRAIGGRIGYGIEFSYQHSLGESNMVSIDAGVPAFTGVEAVATYDWIDPFGTSVPWDHKGEWHWYMGVGGGVSYYWPYYYYGYGYGVSSGTHVIGVGVAGRIGVEYDFWFPLQLSIDWRPVIGPSIVTGNGSTGVGFNVGGLYAGAIALGVRYKF